MFSRTKKGETNFIEFAKASIWKIQEKFPFLMETVIWWSQHLELN